MIASKVYLYKKINCKNIMILDYFIMLYPCVAQRNILFSVKLLFF